MPPVTNKFAPFIIPTCLVSCNPAMCRSHSPDDDQVVYLRFDLLTLNPIAGKLHSPCTIRMVRLRMNGCWYEAQSPLPA